MSDPIYSRARGRSVDSYWRGGETARQEDRARHHSEGFIFRVLLTALTIWLFAAPSAWAKEVQSTEPTLEAIEKAFESAVGQLTGGDSKGAVLALEDLRARHGKRLDARLRHGISSVLMFAHLTLPDEAAAARVGATLFRELPEAFVSFKELSNGITDPVASSIYVLTILTAKGESLIYLHNASKEAIEIRQANKFAVKYGYKTTSTSSRQHRDGRLTGAADGRGVAHLAGGRRGTSPGTQRGRSAGDVAARHRDDNRGGGHAGQAAHVGTLVQGRLRADAQRAEDHRGPTQVRRQDCQQRRAAQRKAVRERIYQAWFS